MLRLDLRSFFVFLIAYVTFEPHVPPGGSKVT